MSSSSSSRPAKKGGSTLSRIASMRFMKASTPEKAALDEANDSSNRRSSVNLGSDFDVNKYSANPNATLGRSPSSSKTSVMDMFPQNEGPNATGSASNASPMPPGSAPHAASSSSATAFPGVRTHVIDASGDEKDKSKRQSAKLNAPAFPGISMHEVDNSAAEKRRVEEERKRREFEERLARKKEEEARLTRTETTNYRASDPGIIAAPLPAEIEAQKKLLEAQYAAREAELRAREQQFEMMSRNSDQVQQLSKLDNILSKLDKLDKLDVLFAKLNSGTLSAGGGGAGGIANGSGRGAGDLKKEIEELQKIIFDPNSSEKAMADANIRLEKVLQEYESTPECRAEQLKAKEDKRKKHEPLNKAALQNIKQVYNQQNVKSNTKLLQNIADNPELKLLFMEPDMILKLHQNDYKAFALRALPLEELRAIRACLPNFRRDQKVQLDWVESLDDKIDQLAAAAERAPPPPKPKLAPSPSAKSWKAPPPSKSSGSPGGLFAELLAKGKGGGDGSNLSPSALSRSSSGGISSPAASSPAAAPAPYGKLPPPGPPKFPPLPPKMPTASATPTPAPTGVAPAAPAPPAMMEPPQLRPVIEALCSGADRLTIANRPEGEIAKDTRAIVQNVKNCNAVLAAWRPDLCAGLEGCASKVVYAVKALLLARKSNGDVAKASADLLTVITEMKALALQSLGK